MHDPLSCLPLANTKKLKERNKKCPKSCHQILYYFELPIEPLLYETEYRKIQLVYMRPAVADELNLPALEMYCTPRGDATKISTTLAEFKEMSPCCVVIQVSLFRFETDTSREQHIAPSGLLASIFVQSPLKFRTF